MPTQFEVVVYLKTSAELEDLARRVFDSLGGDYALENEPSMGGDFYRLTSMGLEATLFSNVDEMLDEDFESYQYALSFVSTFVDPDFEVAPLEAPLAEYYARFLAFNLDAETATSFYLGTQDGIDLYEIRAFKRNPQYVMDAGITVPRVYMAERRTVEYEAIEGEMEEDGEIQDVEAETIGDDQG